MDDRLLGTIKPKSLKQSNAPYIAMFYLITPTGVDRCWDDGDPYMLEKIVVFNDYLSTGSRGRMSKRYLSYLLLTDPRWDLRPETWGATK